MVKNPFLSPKSLDGREPDPTAGRGYVDDSSPTRLTRRMDVLIAKIQQRLVTATQFAKENQGFDRVPLRPDEQLENLSKMGTDDLRQLAGVYGVDEVQAMRRRVIAENIGGLNGI